MNCDPREIARILDDIGGYSDEESVDQAEVNVRESANRQDFVQSNKENEMVTFNGHQFWKHYGYKQKMYWRCIKRITDGCPARLHTNSNTGLVLKIVGKHSNHGISAAAIVLRQLTQQVKEACTTTMEHPSTIFNNVLSGVPEAVQAKLDKSAIRKVVQRKRKLVNSEPEVPNGLNFVVPDGYRTYRFGLNDPELFLLGDQVYENNNRLKL
uniref:FLYWCH-type domain-containing protein n=1 Tax=Ditylenchus dipsaci TaxID=166011 RepID=A0A915E3L6_9BILA